MDKRAYPVREAAAYLGLSVRTFYREAAPLLPVRYRGATRLYDVADLDLYFESLPPEKPQGKR